MKCKFSNVMYHMNKNQEIRKKSEDGSKRLCIGKCGGEYPATDEFFFFRKSAKNGKSYPSSMCKACERTKAAESRRARYATESGKKEINAQTSAYRSKPEKKAMISEHLKDRYANDLEYRIERKASSMAWKKSNKIRNQDNKAEWYQRNKQKIYLRLRERFRADPALRLRNNLRRAIWEALVVNGGDKAGRSILKFLPYSMEELRSHLESLWEPWMSWDNYGVLNPVVRTWQIDHIVPQVNLPFSDFDHPNFILCWGLSNLRPLDSSLNLEKGAKS